MKKKERWFSVKTKMYIFAIFPMLIVTFGISTIAFIISNDQIDNFYKQNASDNAVNFASMVDGDFMKVLRATVESDEYQSIREKAIEKENEQLIEDYLKEKGLWDQYLEIRTSISNYRTNIQGVEYLYLVAHGDKDADYDMYLIDDDTTELTETGYYEEREAELRGVDLTSSPEPMISNGDWGWLCSAFRPVYDSEGKCVCIVGCDFSMNKVMEERREFLLYLLSGSLVFTAIILAGSMLFLNKVVVKPLNKMTKEMKNFKPANYADPDEAGVLNLDIRSHDEIGEIYEGIRSMEVNILNYLNDLSALEEDKKKAEVDIKNKDEQIDKLSVETYTDALTRVRSRAAYIKKVEELNQQIKEENIEFAIVMVDTNNLKQVNDDYGHKSGDLYIKGCCHMICEVFKHSPVYRLGGDEFVVILTGSDYDNRKELFDKLRADFAESSSLEDVDPWLRFSAATGMAENASDDVTAELVFKRADKAMYENKTKFKSEHGAYR